MPETPMTVALIYSEREGNLFARRVADLIASAGAEATPVALGGIGQGGLSKSYDVALLLPATRWEEAQCQALVGVRSSDDASGVRPASPLRPADGSGPGRVIMGRVSWQRPRALMTAMPALDGLVSLASSAPLAALIEALAQGRSPTGLAGVAWRDGDDITLGPAPDPDPRWARPPLLSQGIDPIAGLGVAPLLTGLSCSAACPGCAAGQPATSAIGPAHQGLDWLLDDLESLYHKGLRVFSVESPDPAGTSGMPPDDWARGLSDGIRDRGLHGLALTMKMPTEVVSPEVLEPLMRAGLIQVQLRHRADIPLPEGPLEPGPLGRALALMKVCGLAVDVHLLAWPPGPDLATMARLHNQMRPYPPLSIRWGWLPAHRTDAWWGDDPYDTTEPMGSGVRLIRALDPSFGGPVGPMATSLSALNLWLALATEGLRGPSILPLEARQRALQQRDRALTASSAQLQLLDHLVAWCGEHSADPAAELQARLGEQAPAFAHVDAALAHLAAGAHSPLPLRFTSAGHEACWRGEGAPPTWSAGRAAAGVPIAEGGGALVGLAVIAGAVVVAAAGGALAASLAIPGAAPEPEDIPPGAPPDDAPPPQGPPPGAPPDDAPEDEAGDEAEEAEEAPAEEAEQPEAEDEPPAPDEAPDAGPEAGGPGGPAMPAIPEGEEAAEEEPEEEGDEGPDEAEEPAEEEGDDEGGPDEALAEEEDEEEEEEEEEDGGDDGALAEEAPAKAAADAAAKAAAAAQPDEGAAEDEAEEEEEQADAAPDEDEGEAEAEEEAEAAAKAAAAAAAKAAAEAAEDADEAPGEEAPAAEEAPDDKEPAEEDAGPDDSPTDEEAAAAPAAEAAKEAEPAAAEKAADDGEAEAPADAAEAPGEEAAAPPEAAEEDEAIDLPDLPAAADLAAAEAEEPAAEEEVEEEEDEAEEEEEEEPPEAPEPTVTASTDPSPNSPANNLTIPMVDLTLPSIPSIFSTLVKLNFMSKFVMLPTAFAPTPPPMFVPGDDLFTIGDLGKLAINLFKCPSPFKIHVDTALGIGAAFEKFIDDVSRGIILAWNLWSLTTKFSGIIINGPTGMLPPGGMIGGPTMQWPIMMALGFPWGMMPTGLPYAKSICAGIAQGFDAWSKAYTNPAIPFPGGAVCVGSMIPSPNVPIPLASGTSAAEAMVSPNTLKGLMISQHGMLGNHAEALFDSFAKAFNTMFTLWKSTNFIMMCIGAGGVAPVPPAPPAPVVGAIGNGGLILGMPVL